MIAIETALSGKVLHDCEEPLSEHRGHGSAKNTKSDYEVGRFILRRRYGL